MKGLERIAADRRHLVAQQVRCSTGFTWGRIGAAGVPAVPPRPVPEIAQRLARVERERAVKGARANALLAWLRVWPEGNYLPPAMEIGRALGWDREARPERIANHVGSAFATLEARGVLVTVSGTHSAFRGERAVLLRDPARLLRTERAPPFWEQLLRGAR